MSEVDQNELSFRERVKANPRPALVWLAGATILLALEFGRYTGWILRLGDGVWFTIEGAMKSVRWVEGNVASVIGSTAGTVALVIASILVLMLAATFVKWAFPSLQVAKLVGREMEPTPRYLLNHTAITAVLAVAVLLLVLTPLGGLADTVVTWVIRRLEFVADLPTLTDRDVISNEGWRTPDGGWEGTFLGLTPAWAWALRVAVVYLYVAVVLAWLWNGYNIFRAHYREADWTPRDDSVNRLRNHYWGLFGLVAVLMFIVMALWAPALSPVLAEHNLYQPYENSFNYFDGEEVREVLHGTANLNARSEGGDKNVGPLSYDDYDRWAPLGTTTDGKDLFTFLAYGARTSLVVGLVATILGAGLALIMAMMTAYFKGLLDLMTVIASDTIISMPQFLLVLLLTVVFKEGNHPIADVYDGGLLLALIFGATIWPGLWRAVRGPALQIAEEEWIDAARSYGQSPMNTMRKHMSPYIAGYMMVYASLILGGVIIGVAALSFLGLGIEAPTPEWGRAVNEGRQYAATRSWHIATIPGIAVVIVVTGFNALGDGIRDAIDPESEAGKSTGGGAVGGGG